MQKALFAAVLCGALIIGCLSGCGPSAEARNRSAGPATNSLGISPLSHAAVSETGGEGPEITCTERFKPYEPFGLLYDAETNGLWYQGKLVRWFEDYYPLSWDGAQAGNDFLDENGVVDVYAVRDLSNPVRADDGSYDPGGTLVGVEEFPEEAFSARDLEALRNPAPVTATAGGGALSEEELKAIAAEYEPWGVVYNAAEGCWYFNGEKVRIFRDVLISNGKSLSGGGFHGVIRTSNSEDGVVDIETVRDYAHPDSRGYGTLTGVQKLENA